MFLVIRILVLKTMCHNATCIKNKLKYLITLNDSRILGHPNITGQKEYRKILLSDQPVKD